MSTLHRGKVVRVTAAGIFVRVDRLSGAHEYGPLPVLEGPWLAGQATEAADAHTHGLGVDLAAGDLVLVGSVGTRPDDLVILGRLA